LGSGSSTPGCGDGGLALNSTFSDGKPVFLGFTARGILHNEVVIDLEDYVGWSGGGGVVAQVEEVKDKETEDIDGVEEVEEMDDIGRKELDGVERRCTLRVHPHLHQVRPHTLQLNLPLHPGPVLTLLGRLYTP
jgi:hypothetical protein